MQGSIKSGLRFSLAVTTLVLSVGALAEDGPATRPPKIFDPVWVSMGGMKGMAPRYGRGPGFLLPSDSYGWNPGERGSSTFQSAKDQKSSRDVNSDCDEVGNPIIPSTGNKIETEVDFTSSGENPLQLVRTYNHYWEGVGLFGKHWVSNLDYSLQFGPATTMSGCYPFPGGGLCEIGTNTVISAWRPDGRAVKFVRNATDGVFYEDKPIPVAKIVQASDGSFTLYESPRVS